MPHYGIGGFHQFGPDDYELAVPSRLVIDYKDEEMAGFDESQLAIYRWNVERRDWDYVGGERNASANTVTTTIQPFGLYTLGLRMPAGVIGLTATGGVVRRRPRMPSDASWSRARRIGNNDGTPVADGALFTVRSVAALDTDAVTLRDGRG